LGYNAHLRNIANSVQSYEQNFDPLYIPVFAVLLIRCGTRYFYLSIRCGTKYFYLSIRGGTRYFYLSIRGGTRYFYLSIRGGTRYFYQLKMVFHTS
jgi:branched-subunit amino acid transport protein AzlD